MSAKDPQMKLRLPSAIKDEIERISSDTGRSMNAEIVRRLEWVLGSGSRYYEIDGPDYPEHWRSQAEQQHPNLYGSKYRAEDFPDDQTSSDGLDAVERALIRMWRAMNDGERNALAVVAEQLADKARHGDVS
ncbi:MULTISPECIES: Arc family DNA-binding protein [Asaia]|uniref:Arc family DNA-binding protein n=1 Tax=Asaia TaxID=91914 RepID=UPI0003D38FEC|nr:MULTISPECIES: Arc family DNA-binding protein [Asaia]ETC99694.1 DNA-binding protein [Asaia sp. SF2.1]